jgi:4,5-DOPA dioxygenase extradiol
MNANAMPAAFIGHGSPMNTLARNRYTSAWHELGRLLPRPRAVLSISAHWFINGTAVTAMPRPRVIHDFYGFPRALFEFDYPCPGAPEVAQEVVDLLRPAVVSLDHDSWGIDHGTWSVLAHVFPKADVPVVQLSIHAGEELQYHLDLGAKLAALRERGIFMLGSGNVVHNLRRAAWDREDELFDWGQEFDAAVQETMTTDPPALARSEQHPAYDLAVPTPEHFLPLAYLAGLCGAAREPAQVLCEGGTLGSITMTSYVLGCRSLPKPLAADAAAGALAEQADVPPEHSNL